MQHILASHTVHTIQPEISGANTHVQENPVQKFFGWCNAQEEKRFLWLAVGFIVNIGAVLPLTVLALILAGINTHFLLLLVVCCVNVPVLALNLAAQPTKVTLPSLFFAWVVNAIVIAYCIAVFFLQ